MTVVVGQAITGQLKPPSKVVGVAGPSVPISPPPQPVVGPAT